MSKYKVRVFRILLLTTGIAFVSLALVLLCRQRLAEGFLCAFLGLSAVSVYETDFDYGLKLDARTFTSLRRGRSPISTLGKLCDITSYFCLAAALLSWLVLR